MARTSKRWAYYVATLLRASPAIAETAEDVLAEEETAWAEEIGPPEPAAPPERVWWLETADGRRLRL